MNQRPGNECSYEYLRPAIEQQSGEKILKRHQWIVLFEEYRNDAHVYEHGGHAEVDQFVIKLDEVEVLQEKYDG